MDEAVATEDDVGSREISGSQIGTHERPPLVRALALMLCDQSGDDVDTDVLVDGIGDLIGPLEIPTAGVEQDACVEFLE
jgi:hypothetical protein